MTLDFARSLPVEPGGNRRGAQADTTWLFLLPSLELGHVALVGDVGAGTATALAAMAPRLSRLDPGGGDALADAGLVVVGRRGVGALSRDGGAVAGLRRVLADGGAIFLEAGAPARALASLAARLDVRSEVLLAAGAAGSTGHDTGVTAWRVPATRTRSGARRRAEAALRLTRAALPRPLGSAVAAGGDRVSEADASIGVRSVRPVPPRPAAGHGVLLHRSAEPGALPDYVRAAAQRAGWPVRAGGWRIAPPRGYRSQKVIFFVEGEDGTPGVVKLTQDAHFNALLDNEADALEHLASLAPGRGPRVPRLRFRTRHAGLSVVGEEALEGRPFVRAAAGGGHCPTAAAAAAAITRLATATRHPASGVGDALDDVVSAYVGLFRPPSSWASRLRAAQDELEALGTDLPLVFMHGDATVFNVLVSEAGEAGFVDWENAEPSGMPLWDLLHFLAAHHAWSEERSGRRTGPADVARALCGGGRLEPLRGAATATYLRDVGVPPDALPALRLTWAARHAVREARQLRPDALREGFHHRLLGHLVTP